MYNKIGLVLSIREKSTRYPGKVLKQMHGQTVTEHLIDRLKLANGFDKLIIGTSNDPRDRVFEKIAQEKNIEIYFGSKEDKLKRYLQICNYYNLYAVVIVDGDDILCFPEICTITAKEMNNSQYDVVFWNGLPVGAASSGIKKEALIKIMDMKEEKDTEVWGGYFRQSSEFKVLDKSIKDKKLYGPNIRMTLDYKEDYNFFKLIFDRLYIKNHNFSSYDIMDLLNKNPKIISINKQAQKKYEIHLKKSAPVRFKNNL